MARDDCACLPAGSHGLTFGAADSPRWTANNNPLQVYVIQVTSISLTTTGDGELQARSAAQGRGNQPRDLISCIPAIRRGQIPWAESPAALLLFWFAAADERGFFSLFPFLFIFIFGKRPPAAAAAVAPHASQTCTG